MRSIWTRSGFILACLAVPVAGAFGQQTTVHPEHQLPAESLTPQQVPPLTVPPTVDESRQQGQVMTHGLNFEPNDPPETDKPKSDTPENDQKLGNNQPSESGQRDESSPRPQQSESPAIGARTPTRPEPPDARDFARRDHGSLLNRAPEGFAPLRDEGRSTRGPAFDPGAAFEPCELLVMSTTITEAQRIGNELTALGIDIRRRHALPNLGIILSTFCVPEPEEVEQTIRELTHQYPSLVVAPNHRYVPAAETGYYAESIRWQDGLYTCGSGRRVGLVDTGIDLRHRVFAGARVRTRSLLSPGTPAADPEHGTATASVLAGTPGEVPGLINTANLVMAKVFQQRPGAVIDTNAELLVRALDWLLEERVELINMSLAGPANRLLQHAVQTAAASGILIVAAAGNGDRAPAFPAAYEGVVAVTAVDARGRVYRRANRGDYVDFAAPGVDVFLAAPDNRGKYYSGTSFATPFVTAALAVLISRHPEADSNALLSELSNTALDLGDPGRDPTFGWGLVQAPADCTSLAARE